MKSLPSFVCAALLLTATATAATWTGLAGDGNWTTPGNWDTGAPPNPGAGESVKIPAGRHVDYPAETLGDLRVENGGSIFITGALTQSTTHWMQVNNGSLVIEAEGGLRRDAGGNLVIGFTGMSDSSVTLGGIGGIDMMGEIWLGHNSNTFSHRSALNIVGGGSVNAWGEVGIWLWDYDAPESAMSINFSGPSGSAITVRDRIGIRPAGGAANSQADWRELWDLGLLTADGLSGLSGASFSDYFRTGGTPEADLAPYYLYYEPVPEPASLTLSALACGALLMRRTRRK